MTKLRAVIFWAHLATGLTVGAVVLIMAATGVLLTYQRQIQAWADTRDLPAAQAGGAPLSPDEIVARARAQVTGPITGVRWRRDAGVPVEVEMGRDRTVFVDARSGTVLGAGSARTRAFFRAVTDLHRWLALPAEHRQIGRVVTGAANLAFLFMALSGFYLWWPRNATARAFRSALLFRRGLRPKARDFNWHTVTGFWSLVPLIIIISSAVVISYAWAGALVERAAAEDAPRPQPTSPPPRQIAGDSISSGELLARAAAHVPDWRSITLQLPSRDGRATFVIDTGSGGQPHRIGRLTLDAVSGAVLEWTPFSSASRAARLRGLLRYAHTGEVGGMAGQTLAGLVAAGVVLLVWTGSALALRRFGAWRRRRNAVR